MIRKQLYFFRLGILFTFLYTILTISGCKQEELDEACFLNDETEPYTLQDSLAAYDANVWEKSDWSNGLPFATGWCPDQIDHTNDQMIITLTDQICHGESYSSGEYRSKSFFSFGRFEVRMKAASGSGLVSSFFTYTGPSDGNSHDEIDFEILGKDTTKLQVNYWKNGVQHPVTLDLGFDAATDFHIYAFDWSSTSILWYVDNQLVHSVSGTTEEIPQIPGRIMMNFWACSGIDSWCGAFSYPGDPIHAYYDYVFYQEAL